MKASAFPAALALAALDDLASGVAMEVLRMPHAESPAR
jgi:hypothetical protein